MGEDLGLKDGERGSGVVWSQLGFDGKEDATDPLGQPLDMGGRDMDGAGGSKAVDLPSVSFHGPDRSAGIATAFHLTNETDLSVDELDRRAIVGRNGCVGDSPMEGSAVRQALDVGPVIEGQHDVMLVDEMAGDVAWTEGMAAADTDQDAQGGMEANANAVKDRVDGEVGYSSHELDT